MNRQAVAKELVAVAELLAASKEVTFLKENGDVFSVARTPDAAFSLWQKNKWDFVVNGKMYRHNDWQGREAIERLFGRSYQLASGTMSAKDEVPPEFKEQWKKNKGDDEDADSPKKKESALRKSGMDGWNDVHEPLSGALDVALKLRNQEHSWNDVASAIGRAMHLCEVAILKEKDSRGY